MPHPNRQFRRVFLLTSLVLMPAIFFAKGCSTPLANRNPVGQVFPTVVGHSLEKNRTELPAALSGGPSILLIGYEQKTQFDIDRWLMGLIQTEAVANIVELPTIPGLVPSIASGWIDDGMRSGIPPEDWGSVVTLYGAAATPVVAMTGNENAQNTRVIVLNSSGMIMWFDDTGYSPRKAIAVAELVSKLNKD
jgi:hypothetical protein